MSDSTCYIERNEVRQLVIQHCTVSLAAALLVEVDALPISVADDFREHAPGTNTPASEEDVAIAIYNASSEKINRKVSWHEAEVWLKEQSRDFAKAAIAATKSAPACLGSLPSGESDLAVTPGCAGADTSTAMTDDARLDAFCALRDMWDEDECPSWPEVSDAIDKLLRASPTATSVVPIAWESLTAVIRPLIEGAIGDPARKAKEIADAILPIVNAPPPADTVREALECVQKWIDDKMFIPQGMEGCAFAPGPRMQEMFDKVRAALSVPAPIEAGWQITDEMVDRAVEARTELIQGFSFPSHSAIIDYRCDYGLGTTIWSARATVDPDADSSAMNLKLARVKMRAVLTAALSAPRKERGVASK